MILINRLHKTADSWSKDFQERLEAVADNRVLFYGEPISVLSNSTLFENLAYYGYKSMLELRRKVEMIGHENIEKIIFLDSMQLPFQQMIGLDREIPFEIYVHVSKDYQDYVHAPAYYKQNSLCTPMLVSTSSTALSYGLHESQYRSIGCPLLPFQNASIKRSKTVIWAGNDINNPVKGFPDFQKLMREFPDFEFHVCTRRIPLSVAETLAKEHPNMELHVGLTSEEYQKLASTCEIIVSTAFCESFGLSVMDAVATGTIPLCRDVGSYHDLFPRNFLYSDILQADLYKAQRTDEAGFLSLEMVVNHFSAKNVYERLINPMDCHG
jgi:hypothetical protein